MFCLSILYSLSMDLGFPFGYGEKCCYGRECMSIYRFILCNFRRTYFVERKEVAEELVRVSVILTLFDGKDGLPVARETLRPGDHQEGTKVEAPQLAKEGPESLLTALPSSRFCDSQSGWSDLREACGEKEGGVRPPLLDKGKWNDKWSVNQRWRAELSGWTWDQRLLMLPKLQPRLCLSLEESSQVTRKLPCIQGWVWMWGPGFSAQFPWCLPRKEGCPWETRAPSPCRPCFSSRSELRAGEESWTGCQQ